MGWQNWDTWVIVLDDWREVEVISVQKVAWVILHFLAN
jgi:hypothetical protein